MSNLPAENSRIRHVDYFKAISIILVILAHATFANEGINAWIHSFNMPAFFFASGFFLKDRNDFDFASVRSFVWKRLQALIFPYLVWALLYASLTPMNVARVVYGSHAALASAGSLTSLWFLTTLFCALVMFAVCKLIFKKRFTLPVKLIVTAAALAIAALLPRFSHGYPWNLNVAFYAFGFQLLGNVLFPLIDRFRNFAAGKGRVPGVLISLLAVAVTSAGTLLYLLNLPEGKMVSTADAFFGYFPIFVVVALLGSLFTAAVSILLDLLLPRGGRDPLLFIGRNTFCIFALHKPIVKILFRKAFTLVPLPAPVALIITCAGTLLICCLLSLLIDRYLPLLAGKIPGGGKAKEAPAPQKG